MKKLVLLRHGQSEWNKENRFTGWIDVDLSEQGLVEAKRAGELIKEAGIEFDCVFTSVLKRAIKTMWITLEETDQMWLPVYRHWRLNERHYGNLQGLNKPETVKKFGEEQVFTWRRSYATPPPALDSNDPTHPKHDRRYRNVDIPAEELPAGEALKQTLERFLPLWETTILPRIKKDETVLIVAHGNSLRALIKHIDGISEDSITELNIPTAIPLVYELSDDCKPLRHYYLGDAEAATKAAEAVAHQTK